MVWGSKLALFILSFNCLCVCLLFRITQISTGLLMFENLDNKHSKLIGFSCVLQFACIQRVICYNLFIRIISVMFSILLAILKLALIEPWMIAGLIACGSLCYSSCSEIHPNMLVLPSLVTFSLDCLVLFPLLTYLVRTCYLKREQI